MENTVIHIVQMTGTHTITAECRAARRRIVTRTIPVEYRVARRWIVIHTIPVEYRAAHGRMVIHTIPIPAGYQAARRPEITVMEEITKAAEAVIVVEVAGDIIGLVMEAATIKV
ncbi:MAG: hypothetical protein K2N43_07355 [Lachnospiraceae bacterium]|nr:hypothetical protein [Lachnospiraceae bacterium]